MGGGNGFDIKGLGVSVGSRGVEVQPGTGDLGVHLVALETSSDTSELHVHL